MHYGVIIIKVPLMEAKHACGLITTIEYEEFLLAILSDCATITERLGDSEELNHIKDYIWLKMDFTT